MPARTSPLADHLRPNTFTNFHGQEHLVGKTGLITKLLNSNSPLPSLIFWGPPGSGKTTLAHLISTRTKSHFIPLSAVNAKLKDLQQAVSLAKAKLAGTSPQANLLTSPTAPQKTILFIDEIHRWNKAQQDALLPHVETGTLTLIGATTENPSFEVIGPLLSRCQVVLLHPLTKSHLEKILKKATTHLKITLRSQAKTSLLEISAGDARRLLNILETASHLAHGRPLTPEHIKQASQERRLLYDKAADEHYNTISAFIKSMRASQPDAALYYLARMVDAGEDPLFIARRMVIFASEDIGMAQPTALVVANEVFRACETIGYPECQINLAHGTAYLAKAPKDRSAYDAYFHALKDVKTYGNLPIPKEILNAPTKLMKDLDYGKNYQPYTKTNLLPDKLKGKKYYSPKLPK